jgi:hypothetical protein
LAFLCHILLTEDDDILGDDCARLELYIDSAYTHFSDRADEHPVAYFVFAESDH